MTPTATLEQHIDALAASSPDWLAELRRDAWAKYREIPYPAGREELWRFTDVKSIHPDNFALLAPDTGTEVTQTPDRAESALELSDVESAGRAVHADGTTLSVDLTDEARSAGSSCAIWIRRFASTPTCCARGSAPSSLPTIPSGHCRWRRTAAARSSTSRKA